MAIRESVIPVIAELIKIGKFGKSTDSVTEYAAAILGLDEAQQRVALSARGLSAEEIKLVMARSKDLSTLQSLSVAELAEKLHLDAAQIALLGKAEATDKVTVAMLKNLMATKSIKPEQRDYIATLLAETAATEAQTAANTKKAASLKLVAASAKEALVAMLANPMTWVMMIPAMMTAVEKFNDLITVSAEEARETADNLHSAFEETASELENVNSELTTSRDRIKELTELSDAGTITLVEQEELKNLREEVELLEARQRILDEQKQDQGKEADAALVTAFEKQGFDFSDEDYFTAELAMLQDERKKLLEASNEMVDGLSDAEVNRLNEIEKRIGELGTMFSAQDFVMAPSTNVDFETYINRLVEQYKMLDKIAPADMSESTLTLFEDTRKKLVDAAGTLQTDWLDNLEVDEETRQSWTDLFNLIDMCINPAEHLTKALEELPDSCRDQLESLGNTGELTAEQVEKLAEDSKELAAVLDNGGVSAEDIAKHFNALSSSTQEASGSVNDLENNFGGILETLDKLNDKYDLLTKVQDEFSDSGNLSISTLNSIAEKFPEMQNSIGLYIAGLKTGKELLEDLSNAYQVDADNYKRAISQKLAASPEFYNSLSENQKTLINDLADSYGVDLDNFKDLESKKLEFQAQIISKLASNYSKYTGATVGELKAALAGIQSTIKWTSDGESKNALIAEEKQLLNTLGALSKMQQAIDSIVLDSAAYDPKKYSGSSSSSGKGSGSAKEVEEYTAAIDKYREAEERLRKAQEDRASIESNVDDTDVTQEKITLENQLITAYGREQSALQNLNRQRSASIDAGAESLRKLGFEVQYNADTNDLWVSNMDHLNELMAAGKGKYDSVQEATNALRQDTEKLIGTITDLNDKNREGTESWADIEASIRDAKVNIINDLKDIVSQSSDSVDEIQNVSDTLHDAADEFAANDGFITVDTYQSLIDLGPQYMQMLKDENGLWEINEERINDVIAARTRQLAVENAMSYVERIKLATQEGAVENLNDLIFVTTDAANSTWGLVYAELELMHTMGDLNDSQYEAALHNIQVMQDLAENAVANIGKATDAVETNLEETRKQLEATKDGLQDTLDELEGMQDGAGDLVDYVMEMLKHRIQQQIELLEEMKDKYSEIVDMKKESLDATKDEQDYQKTIAKKLREMAKLQERINALSLDDSRSAQAERAKLLEEMAELQGDLDDTQASNSIEAQKNALDQMEEDYHAEKDAEIKVLEDSISSTQKLYDMAIDYIRNNWNTLYSELIAWNTEYGSDLNSQITAAWDAAQAAAQRYGDFVSAIMGGISNEIDSITQQIEDLDQQISNLSTSTSSHSGSIGMSGGVGNSTNTVVGDKNTHTGPNNEEMVHSIIKRMYSNMNEHGGSGSSTSTARKAQLSQENLQLGAQLNQYGVSAYRSTDKEDLGTWYTDKSKSELLFKKYKKYTYHTGGFVGGTPLKPNEQYIKAEDGELILTADQQDSFAAQIDRIETMAKVFTDSIGNIPISARNLWPDGTISGGGTVSNVTNNNKPIEIHMGDTIIQGPASPETVRRHEQVSEKMVNDLARLLGIKW